MQISRREQLSRILAVTSLGVAFWVLILSAAYYAQPFFVRAAAAPEEGSAEVERLACIQDAVGRMTVPGEGVRILVENGDVYLIQRLTELIYPRVNLVADGGAPLVVIGAADGAPAGVPVCGDVSVSVERKD